MDLSVVMDLNALCVCVYVCVVGMNMVGAPHGGAMENYASWPNDSRVMQHNPGMNNLSSKHYTVSIVFYKNYILNFLYVPTMV